MELSFAALDGNRRFGLDVLRAMAIAGVVCSHFGGGFFGVMGPFGFLGVELFFVLSGFLIGGLLLDIAARDPSPREWFTFMVRRWMRTVPLYALWTILLALTFPPAEGWPVVLRTLTFIQNLAWPMPADNWFGVSWSLTIEEWFYLLFSALFLALAAYRRNLAVPISLAVFLLAPLIFRIIASDAGGAWDTTVRKVVATRLDAIAYGVALAVLWRSQQPLLLRWRYPLLVVGVAALFSVGPFMNPQGAMLWLIFPITSAAFAMFIPMMAALPRPRNIIAPIVEWISTRSYGLYIVHLTLRMQGVAQLSDLGVQRDVAVAAMLLMSLLFADLSWRFFEQPILRARPKQFAAVAGDLLPTRQR